MLLEPVTLPPFPEGIRISLRQMHLLKAPMGGTLVIGGATFRVFAPHAKAVYVSGPFNDWARMRAAAWRSATAIGRSSSHP